jgi:hypothetical protein
MGAEAGLGRAVTPVWVAVFAALRIAPVERVSALTRN